MIWKEKHEPHKRIAGMAQQARQRFALTNNHLHVDTTSFQVSGAYETDAEEAEPACITITYSYSRDHRADLKQWMVALVTTHDGEVPLFMRPLDGNSSDKVSISTVVGQVIEQLRVSEPAE